MFIDPAIDVGDAAVREGVGGALTRVTHFQMCGDFQSF